MSDAVKHIKSEIIRDQVKDMVMNYIPKKTKETNIKMKIILKDEVPVAQNPRRLAAEQRQVCETIFIRIRQFDCDGKKKEQSVEIMCGLSHAKCEN